MYHDEFAPRPVRNRRDVGGAYSGLAIEVGGGVSAATVSSFVLPEIPILLSLGGLLPLVACCFLILLDRCREAGTDLLKRCEASRLRLRERLVTSISGRSPTALRGPRFAQRRHGKVRAGFDRSRRLG
jgi:hypothetical protein